MLRHLLNAPLYQKPEIGSDQFRPLDKARPQQTADGLREIMTTIAAVYDNTTHDYILLRNLIAATKLRRLTIEKYLGEAQAKHMIRRTGQYIRITDYGKTYLAESGIVDA